MRAAWPTALLAAAVTAVAGCSGGDDDAPAADQPRPAQSASEGGGPAGPAPTPVASLTGLVAGRTVDDTAGLKITVVPVTLKRQGKLALLEVAARNGDPQKRANLSDSLRGTGSSFDDVTLVDPANGKRYLVARDSKDECLCTSFVGGISVEPGGTAIVGAYFAAPPESVTNVNVVMPGAGTFTGVPVS
jgi:hypothetical protein